jgi:hypothetical protein
MINEGLCTEFIPMISKNYAIFCAQKIFRDSLAFFGLLVTLLESPNSEVGTAKYRLSESGE